AIGKGGVVLLTIDGGNSWDLLNTSQYVQFNTDLNDLVFVNNSGTFNLVVVGNKGLTARSANLTTANPTFGFINGIPTTQDVKSVVFDGAKYVCITNENTTLPVFSRFYNSIDINGISWTEEKSISNTTGLNDVTFISNSDAVAVGEDGRLYKCIGLLNTSFVLNTSARWVLVENNLVNHIKSVEFFDVNNAVALVEHSSSDRRLYRTIDGGSNWTQVSSFTKFNSITLDFQKQYALAVGDNGTAQVFTPNPNLSMDPIDIKTNLTSNLTSGWINRIGSGLSAKTEVILADASNKVYFTANAFNLNPSWISQNVTGSIILKAFKAKHFSTGAQEIKAVGISVSNTVIPFTINPSTNTIGMGGVVTSLSNASLIDLNYTNSSSEDDIIVYNNLSGRIAKIRISGTTVTTFGNYLAQTILHSPLANNPGKQFSSRLIGGIYRFLVIANTSVLNYASENSSVTNIDALSRTNYTNSLSPVNLKNIEMFAGNAIANGTDGQLYTRSSAALWSTVKLQSNNTINDVEVTSTTNELIVVGNGGYAAKGLLVSNAYAPISLNFAAGVNVTENINEVRLKSNVLYAAADQGKVFYSPTFTTTAITKLSHGAENLNGLCFKTGGTTAFFVGNNTTLHDVAGTNFLVKKDLFLPEFVDVHFSDLATGTLASSFIISATIQNAVLRTTQTAGVKWNYALPTSGVGPLVVKKVFTYNNQIRAVMGTNLHRIINNVVTEQTIGYLLNAIDVSSLPNTNTAYVLRGTSTRYVGTVTPNSTNTGLVVVANIPSATISANAQSIQAFADNSFIAVGNSGYSKYFRGLTSFDVTLPSGVGTPNLKDVTFFDYRNGVVVGDNGMFWKTTNTTVNPSGFLIGGAWKAIDAEGNDPYNLVSNNTLGFNFSAVAFAGPHYLVYGGAYSAAGTVAAVRRAYAPINRITARFFYDRLGRIVVSQNARQYNVSDPTDRKFSYTRYDELGRVFEAGEKQENADALKRFASIFGTYIETSYSPSTVDDDKLATWLNQNEGSNPTAKRREVTKSYYDFSHTEFVLPTSFTGQVDPSTQRKRIVHVAYESEDDMDPTTYDHATHYNYDIHGNVVTLLQDNHKMAIEFPSLVAQQFKRMDYTFDLISGNVHRMSYQDGEADQWHHAYEYDADNRITNAYTNENTPLLPNTASNYALANESVQNSDWQNDASYFYYQHGPLARTELGADHVQGSDYIYNLQGWMKGVNSTGLKAENDPGNDGLASSINEQFARDIYGFNLSYFKGDYQAIDATKNAPTATFYGQMANNTFAQASGVDNRSLWNGNIRSMQTTIADPNNNNTALPLLNTYEYDQLNRLSEARSFTNYSSASNEWGSAVGYNNRYYNAFTYDAMGNILSQKRHNDAGAKIEDLQYQYNYNNTNQLVQNRLYHVNEDPSAVADPESIEDMGVFTPSTGINVSNNYRYDAEGRLIQDLQEGIQNIIWRVDGKVKEIVRIPGFNGAATKNIRFDYDAMGHRIAKHVLDNMSGLLEKSTYYVLDAQGNTLSVYEHEVSASSVAYKQKERYIYGSSRIGVNNKETDMYATNSGNSNVLSHEMGLRSYELTNHLGNVLSVISDKVIPHPSGASVAYYKADILQSMDYSPFGVTLKGRNLKKTGLADLLRYGFNGMEKDDELKGEGNSYDFGARILDTRLGRWLSIDPQFRKYPDLCAYNFVANNPLLFVDPNGEEIIIHYKDADGNPKQYKYTPGIKPTVENQFVQQVHEAVSYVMKNDDEQVFQTISNDESKINIVETFTFDQFADKTGDWRFNYNSGDGKVNESSTEATISWNPLAMLVTTDGGGLAPSTALLHEADHARGFLALKTKAEFDAWKRTKTHYDESSPNFAFDDAEEKRVITGAERKYVNKVNSKEKDKWTKFKSYTYTNEYGYNVKATWWRTDYAQQQGIRNNHSGSVTKSKGVNSITRADGQRVLGEAVTYGRFIKKILGKS
ncbi:MAG: RHS repeat-associated core domain-containing protein, partial [Fluviicola sp.]